MQISTFYLDVQQTKCFSLKLGFFKKFLKTNFPKSGKIPFTEAPCSGAWQSQAKHTPLVFHIFALCILHHGAKLVHERRQISFSVVGFSSQLNTKCPITNVSSLVSDETRVIWVLALGCKPTVIQVYYSQRTSEVTRYLSGKKFCFDMIQLRVTEPTRFGLGLHDLVCRYRAEIDSEALVLTMYFGDGHITLVLVR